ncbi:hypothetical protein ACP4OV_009074 [Aristida adscensionis]
MTEMTSRRGDHIALPIDEMPRSLHQAEKLIPGHTYNCMGPQDGSLQEKRDQNVALSAFFSKGAATLNVWLGASFFLKMVFGHNPSIKLSVCSIAYLVCLILAFGLHCSVGTRCCGSSSSQQQQEQMRWRQCTVVYLSILLRMVAAAALVLFLDGAHAIVLVPLLFLALAFVAHFFLKTYRHPEYEYPGMNWWIYHRVKEELEVRSNLSAQVVSLAFGGLSGIVLGSVTVNATGVATWNLTAGLAAVGPEGFLFYAVVFGLLVQLLTTVPIPIDMIVDRARVAKIFIPCLAYSTLLSLVVAAALAAGFILRALVLLVLLVIVVAGAIFVWRCREPATAGDSGQRVEQLGVLSTYCVPSFTVLFTVLMTGYSIYSTASGSTLSQSWWLKGFAFSALSSILFYAFLVVVLADRPEMRSRTSWPHVTIGGAMAIALICAVVAVSQNRAELKKLL